MDCDEAEQALASVFDEECDDAVKSELWVHLSICFDCRDLWSNLIFVRAMERIAQEYWQERKTCQVFKT